MLKRSAQKMRVRDLKKKVNFCMNEKGGQGANKETKREILSILGK
jgi:hypothetical protein